MYKSLGSPDATGVTSNRQLTALRSTSGFTGVLWRRQPCLCCFLKPLAYCSSLAHISYTPLHINKLGVPRLYFTIPCRENVFPAYWWAFQHGSVLEWWLLPFLPLLLSSALSLMLKKCTSFNEWGLQVPTYQIPVWEVFVTTTQNCAFKLGYYSTTQLCANFTWHCLKDFCTNRGLLALLPPHLVTERLLLTSGAITYAVNYYQKIM